MAWLTLNKPEKLNALSMTMVRGMTEAIEQHWSVRGITVRPSVSAAPSAKQIRFRVHEKNRQPRGGIRQAI